MDAHPAFLPSFTWRAGYTGVDLDRLDLGSGRPVLEVGAGHGGVTQTLLEHTPGLPLWCVEPDPGVRAILRARLEGLGAKETTTVLPATIGEALDRRWLPSGIGSVLLVGMAYFLSPEEHAQMWAGLLPLLADDAVVLLGPVFTGEDDELRPASELRKERERTAGATTLEWWAEELGDGGRRHVFRTVLDGEVIEESEDAHPAPRSRGPQILAAIPPELRVVHEDHHLRYLRRR